jgi:hypothetical protein
MCRDVVAEHASLRLELLEPVADDVAHGHDADDLVAVAHHEMAEPLHGHAKHDLLDRVVRVAQWGGAHDLLHAQPLKRSAVQPHGSHDVTLGDVAKNAAVGAHHGEPADIVGHQQRDRRADVSVRFDGDQLRWLSSEQIPNTHHAPPTAI